MCSSSAASQEGRGVFWAQKFKIAKIYGCDINPVYIQAANDFAEFHGLRHDYRLIENGMIPFADRAFDTAVSFDVLEHVDNVDRCMREIYRVLKPGGKAYLVFPQFYQPFESHLGFATHMPGLQCLIPSKTLTRAFVREIASQNDRLSPKVCRIGTTNQTIVACTTMLSKQIILRLLVVTIP